MLCLGDSLLCPLTLKLAECGSLLCYVGSSNGWSGKKEAGRWSTRADRPGVPAYPLESPIERRRRFSLVLAGPDAGVP
jgi:hypothetical protein